MKRLWIFRGVRMVAFGALALALFGYVVMALWNAVLPAAAGLHAINFLQAVGLLVLSRILFGGMRGWGRRGGHWRAWRTWPRDPQTNVVMAPLAGQFARRSPSFPVQSAQAA